MKAMKKILLFRVLLSFLCPITLIVPSISMAVEEKIWIKSFLDRVCPNMGGTLNEQQDTLYGNRIFFNVYYDQGTVREVLDIHEILWSSYNMHSNDAAINLDIWFYISKLNSIPEEERNKGQLLFIASISPLIVFMNTLPVSNYFQKEQTENELLSPKNAVLILKPNNVPIVRHLWVKREDGGMLFSVNSAYIESPLPGADPFEKILIGGENERSKQLILNCINLPEINVYIEDGEDGSYFDQTVDLEELQNRYCQSRTGAPTLVLNKNGGRVKCVKRGRDEIDEIDEIDSCPANTVSMDSNFGGKVCSARKKRRTLNND